MLGRLSGILFPFDPNIVFCQCSTQGTVPVHAFFFGRCLYGSGYSADVHFMRAPVLRVFGDPLHVPGIGVLNGCFHIVYNIGSPKPV